ncbi:MAG: ABC transporter ATP-binding protein [Fusobacteriaceae bacterium]|nr:ABC transporter ATP-binding protein [Fusobacteriaceae bacterium]MBP9510714.1 ABC transporter ATP-binding protein [Fusobacteriaceae bacterium]
MLVIKNLKKRYEKFSLDIENFQVKQGEFISILGQSGSGKSTFLNILAGIETEYIGEVSIKGELSMVFQDSLLLPHLNLFENIAFGLRIKKMDKNEIDARVVEVMKKLEIFSLKDKYPNEISGGEKQRVSIGRALVMKPQLLLMDEPFSSLDENLRERLQEVVKNLQKELGLTIIFVTHDRDEAFYLSDRIALINKGKIEQYDSAINLFTKPISDYVYKFLSLENIVVKDQEIYRKMKV